MSKAQTLDSVVIDIETQAGKSTENIEKLASALANLKGSISGGFKNLEKLNNALQSLSTTTESINLEQLSSQMKGLAEAISPLKTLKDMDARGLTKTLSAIQGIPEVFRRIDAGTLENVLRVSTQLADALTPLADKLGAIGNGYSKLQMLADRYGVSVTKVINYHKQQESAAKKLHRVLEGLKSPFSKLKSASDNFSKTAIKNFDKLGSKIKQIGLSLLGTRTLFTMIRKAASEYQNFDEELQKFSQNVWRAFGAQLAPAIEFAMNLFKQFVRVIYSVILALTGIDLISRANAKAMAGWGKSAKDLLGNLQKFDDLNVVEFPKSSSGDDGFDKIELETIDLTPIQKVIDWVIKLKNTIIDAWNNGGWNRVGEVLAEGINGATGFMLSKIDLVKEHAMNVVTNVTDFINGAIERIDFGKIGKLISEQFILVFDVIERLLTNINWENVGKGLNDFIANIDITGVMNSLTNVFVSLGNVLGGIISNIDFAMVGQKLTEVLSGAMLGLGNIIDSIPFYEIGDAITTTILNIDWLMLWNSALSLFESTFNGIGDFLAGLLQLPEGTFDIDLSILKVKTKEVGDILNDTYDTKVKTFCKDVSNDFDDLWNDSLSTFVDDFKTGFADMFKTFKDYYETYLSPIIKWIGEEVSDLWDNYLKTTINNLISLLGTLWKDVIDPLFRFFVDKVAPILLVNFEVIGAVFSTVIKILIAAINNVIGVLDGLIKFISGVFQGNWKLAWEGITKIFSSTFEYVKSIAHAVINGVIGIINAMIDGINNKLKITIGSTLKTILSTFGVNIKGNTYQLFTIPKIPKLETGTNEIPYEGLYHLHPGEAVVPKKYNPALGNADNEETNRRLDTLIDIMDNLSFTNIVNVGNDQLYKQQQRFNKRQENKYGTLGIY